jgi:hypothetical protein
VVERKREGNAPAPDTLALIGLGVTALGLHRRKFSNGSGAAVGAVLAPGA